MKKLYYAITMVWLSTAALAQQATLTNSLSAKLSSSSASDYITVNVILTNQVDHHALKNNLNAVSATNHERARAVIRQSMQLANASQKDIITFLNQNIAKVDAYQSYWIINMLTIKAKKSVIDQLTMMAGVDYMELYDHFRGKPIEILESKDASEKSVNGIEAGLSAINAPELWALGYSGKARKLFSIDTGVWKDHPAIDDGWLGNHQPINQAWHAVDSPTPVDKDGAHGTHTTGTVLGLDDATNDTIGVAFNAYYMAADPIVTNLNDIKPLPAYIDVFQFALNPDGDTNTTDDIPDVINNSWGIDEHDDTSICAGYVTQMFDAIETAGIANVFSAGNEGSGDTTIGKPQYVSTGLVNTFTVGAVNHHVAGNPIAGFSSRGPTACPATGSIAIKPEVVAPGVNVRSCVDNGNYANYQGTSMAGPHAAGAVLLLKEAFPNATGEEILLALYYSAVDLGVAGEDNTYGMGMIDVKAAYDSLALTYTPTPPSACNYDIAVREITGPTYSVTCNQTISSSFIMENRGINTISSVQISVQLNNETPQIINWTGNLLGGDTVGITLPTHIAQGLGDYELFIKTTIDSNDVECDYINNQRVARFNIRDIQSTLPYSENFESMRIDSSEWLVFNPDGLTTWDTTATGGTTAWNEYSATVQCYDYSGSGQLDDLISTRITLPNEDSLMLRFDVAYQMIHQVIADTMRVYISTDCGMTFTEIYKKGGDSLETYGTISPQFIPSLPNHWRTEYVDITAYAANDVLLKFETYNRSGNNVYLDNIWVYEGAEPVGINEHKTTEVSIYPNPVNDILTIELKENTKNTSVSIKDMLGRTVKHQVLSTSINALQIGNLESGVYMVIIETNDQKITSKIIKH